jgi:parvulin-like peptidyl-prolyl isomerase
MTINFQLGQQTITAEVIINLLAKYQLLPQILRELIIDQSIAAIECTPEEVAYGCQMFCEYNQITEESTKLAWLQKYGMSHEQLDMLTARKLKIEKFKQATWGGKLEAYFLWQKPQLDKIIYSLLRTQDIEVAQELYFRIQAKEQTFSELARKYSDGPEAQTDGLIGPVELKALHPALVQILSISKPGQLWSPVRLGDWFVIVRLEKNIPAQLDENMRQRLLNEVFEIWLSEQIQVAMEQQNSTDYQSKILNLISSLTPANQI